ncbi:MAG: CvpA family protein [Candidatus Hydrothermales bacterium]
MNVLDIISLVILAVFFVIGFGLGFIHAVMSLIGIIIGFFLGLLVIKTLPFPLFVEVILFLIIVIIVGGLGNLLGKFVRRVGKFIPGNRIAGGLLGILVGAYISGFVVFIFSLLNKNNPEFQLLLENSLIAKHLFLLFKQIISPS